MKHLANVLLYQPFYNLLILLVSITPGHNAGVAIILLTILVRFAMTPLKYKSLESQMKQKEIQPELKLVQEKYKDDKQAQSQAVMQLYKDKGVNPVSGCLPMLIQFPILIVLFYIFRDGFSPEHYHNLYSFVHPPASIGTSFLWVRDVAKPDPFYILPVLAGLSQYLYSRSLSKSMPPPSSNANDMTTIMMKQMTYFAPLMTLVFALKFPAALSLYWVSGTLVDWAQQVKGLKRFHARSGGKVSVSVRKREKEAL